MAAVHIRNVPDAVLDALKQRAASHRRSLQQEVLTILEEAAAGVETAPLPPLRLVKVRTGRREAMTREEIYEDER